MNLRPFEVWKACPPGFAEPHWFVILSPPEVCADPRELSVNALACWTLRGEASKIEVRLDGADGFERPTVCACDFLFILPKRGCSDPLGSVSWERQQMLKAKVKEVFRLW